MVNKKSQIFIMDANQSSVQVPNLEDLQLNIEKFHIRPGNKQLVIVFKIQHLVTNHPTMYFSVELFKNKDEESDFKKFRINTIKSGAVQYACRIYGQDRIEQGPMEYRSISRKIIKHWSNQLEWDGQICAAYELSIIKQIMEC